MRNYDHGPQDHRTTDHGLRTTHLRPQTSAEFIKMSNAGSYWERRGEWRGDEEGSLLKGRDLCYGVDSIGRRG
jgi:hypothetical protein